jgi:hypothetical protein
MIDGSDGRNDKNEEKHACQSGENKTRVHLNPQFTYLPERPLRQPYSFKSIHYLPNEIAGSFALGDAKCSAPPPAHAGSYRSP